jgi:DNA-binding XRE family transcriptional regulator
VYQANAQARHYESLDQLQLVALAGRKPRDAERFRKALRTLGSRIVDLRKAKNWTQERLAEASGLTGTSIGQIERAEICCGLDSVFLIARALDASASALLADLDGLIPTQPSSYLEDQL